MWAVICHTAVVTGADPEAGAAAGVLSRSWGTCTWLRRDGEQVRPCERRHFIPRVAGSLCKFVSKTPFRRAFVFRSPHSSLSGARVDGSFRLVTQSWGEMVAAVPGREAVGGGGTHWVGGAQDFPSFWEQAQPKSLEDKSAFTIQSSKGPIRWGREAPGWPRPDLFARPLPLRWPWAVECAAGDTELRSQTLGLPLGRSEPHCPHL